MVKIEKLFDFALDTLKRNPKTLSGLLSGTLLIMLICIACKIPYCMYVVPILIFLWGGIWFLKSGRGIFPSNKYTLVFCIKTDEKSKQHYEKILEKLKTKLDNLNISKEIRIINIAPDIINNREQAVNYRESQGVDLIIWGNAFAETRDSKDVVNFTLSYTYRLNPWLKNKMVLFNLDLLLIAGTRDWIINTDNTLFEEIKVADNFVEAGIFIFGIHLFTDNKLRDALKLFNSLRNALLTMRQDSFKPLIEGRINKIISEIYIILGDELTEKRDYRVAKQCFIELLKFQINQFRVYVNIARLEYLLGDLKKAKEYTSKASEIDKEHPVILLNNAFFMLLEKNYERALFWYKKVLSMNTIDVNISQLLEFLYERFQERKEELGFLFALGIMSYGFYDREKGISDLSLFVNKARNKKEYEKMLTYTREILEAEKYRKKRLRKERKKEKKLLE